MVASVAHRSFSYVCLCVTVLAGTGSARSAASVRCILSASNTFQSYPSGSLEKSMITVKSIHFLNFKALRDATLPLGQFTLLIGANGSGKSTAMQALRLVGGQMPISVDYISKAVLPFSSTQHTKVSVKLETVEGPVVVVRTFKLQRDELSSDVSTNGLHNQPLSTALRNEINGKLASYKVFQFDPKRLTAPSSLSPNPVLGADGMELAGVLDALRDSDPERFEQLNQELSRWLPEYDRILFGTPDQGQRAFMLRTRLGRHPIKAAELSQGTLLALAFLTVAYLPNASSVVCFEEPEHGIHPRLLRNVQDAMYRLAYPENFGEDREAVQVIATTHSPYLLDLYRAHPEEIVIAEKTEDGAHFKRLVDTPYFDKIFEGEHLGELWYTGVFGGVPVAS